MEETGLVIKSNALIEASYSLTIMEQAIILACIGQIRKDEVVTDKTMYKISVADYIDLTDADKGTAYRDMKNAVIRLRRREVRLFELPNGGGRVKNKGRVRIAGWVQTIEYSDDAGEVWLRFNHDMLPYLTNLSKNFTKYSLGNVSKMSSRFGIRLYELLVDWRKSKQNRQKHEVTLIWFKRAFGLEDKYPRANDLRKRVLDPAVKDINTHSDFCVSYAEKKTGRKITHLEFTFKLKKEKPKNTKSKQQNLESWKSYIESNARPGETYEQAGERLKKNNRKLVEAT